MAEFDDKLNSILSNPDAMSQIMQLAQSLSGEQSQSSPQPPPSRPAPAPDLSSFFSGGIDPALLTKLLPIMQELSNQQNSSARNLLYALRPYLKRERQEKIDRALQLAKLFHLGKKFLTKQED